MSWNDFYQRQQDLHAVIEHARLNPEAPLAPVPHSFADTGELLAALQYTWNQRLIGRIEVAVHEVAGEPQHDRIQAVTEAWRETEAANPALRALLDRRISLRPGPEEQRALRTERRMLAVHSGLAGEEETEATTNRIGDAFYHLLRATTPEPAARRSQPCVLAALRGLIPSP